MDNKKSRSEELKEKLNAFFQDITRTDIDYYNKVTQNDLLKLKTTISDVNNILTLMLTLSLGKWISDYFNFTEKESKKLIESIESTGANTNGYDIIIDDKHKIIAEVKTTVPINNGSKYGSAQRDAILKDAVKLHNGKKIKKNKEERHNTDGFIKIICVIDLGVKTNEAVKGLVKEVRTKSEKRKELNEIVNKLEIIKEDINKNELKTNKIYIIPIRINEL